MTIEGKVDGDVLTATLINTYSFHIYNSDAPLLTKKDGDALTAADLNPLGLETYADTDIFTGTNFGIVDSTLDFIFIDDADALSNYDLLGATVGDYFKTGAAYAHTAVKAAGYLHRHTPTIPSYNNATGSDAVALQMATWVASNTAVTPKYVSCVLRKKKFRINYFSFPTGTVIMSTQKLDDYILADITAEPTGKHIFVLGDPFEGDGTTGGSLTHTHKAYGPGWSSASDSNTGNVVVDFYSLVSSYNNEVDNTTVFAYKYTGAYDSAKDQTPIGARLLHVGTDALPGNYSYVTRDSGILRYKASGAATAGGTLEHAHTAVVTAAAHHPFDTPPGALDYRNLGDQEYYTGAGGNNAESVNHMPPWKTYHVIQRDS
jgi:hypothetical protein